MRAMRFLLTFLLIVVACGDEAGPATEIVVYVDADMAVRGRATDVLVTVAGRANTEPDFVVAETIELTTDVLPFQFNFAPRDGDVSRQWEVIVQARDGAAPFVEKAARGIYVEDQSRVLYMVLRNDCADFPACTDPEETCDRGTCRTSIRTPDVLPVYEGGRVPPPDDPTPTTCVTDEECDDGLGCNGEETCDPSSGDADPFGCVDGIELCAPTEFCIEGPMPECATEPCEDLDGDLWQSDACGGNDCDDEEPSINPGATEVEDGVDNDCDDMVDEGFIDCSEVPVTEGSESTCSDLCDNDDDGFTDCDDFQCNRTEACGYCGDPPRLERNDAACGDGCDNDGNGFADCEDFACDGIGACVGAARPCECAADEACLTRVAYGFVGVCGRPCTVGEDADPGMPGLQIDCPEGQACWWDGRPGSSSGVCADLRSSTPPPPSIGARCEADSDCASPFGWGRCLSAAETGFEDGYCTILDCGAPAAPSAICGSAARCSRYDNTSYCLDVCSSDSDCRGGLDGYKCVAGIFSDVSVCVRECADDTGCGSRGVCDMSSDGTRYCRPPSSL